MKRGAVHLGGAALSKVCSLTFSQLYGSGHFGTDSNTLSSPGDLLDLLLVERPAGDVSRPAVSDMVLYQELHGGARLNCDFGGGKQAFTVDRGDLVLAAPDFEISTIADGHHRVRSVAFPLSQWSEILDQATEGRVCFSRSFHYGKQSASPAIHASLQTLWTISNQEGAASNLLARAAGCQILGELCRLAGVSLASPKGGLASWAERRAKELIHARLAEGISLDELACEVHLSPFHFSRMFKQSVGVSPSIYLSKARIERACELLETSDMAVLDIAISVGYSSSQCFSRIFAKYMRMCPSEYRRVNCRKSRNC